MAGKKLPDPRRFFRKPRNDHSRWGCLGAVSGNRPHPVRIRSHTDEASARNFIRSIACSLCQPERTSDALPLRYREHLKEDDHTICVTIRPTISEKGKQEIAPGTIFAICMKIADSRYLLYIMVSRVGLEPTTIRLKVECSTG